MKEKKENMGGREVTPVIVEEDESEKPPISGEEVKEREGERSGKECRRERERVGPSG